MILMAVAVQAQGLYVASYNIRYHNSDDDKEGNVWTKRCQVICDMVNFEHPDIFGTQEVLAHQLDDMLEALDEYKAIGVGRDDGQREGEYAAIFYNTRRMKLVDNGNFWLSVTPDVPSKGWDAACTRICTWGKFKDLKRKKHIFFFNLHLDHVGVKARREAAMLVVEKIKMMAKGKRTILTGDFNVDQNDEIYQIFTQSGILVDTYGAARVRFQENGTFNAFKTYRVTNSRIDHVFVSPSFHVERYGVLTNVYWTPTGYSDEKQKEKDAPAQIDFNRYVPRTPSDHYPVFVRIDY